MTNNERATRIQLALEALYFDETRRTEPVRYLADLMHLCEAEGMPFEIVLVQAQTLYEREAAAEDR